MKSNALFVLIACLIIVACSAKKNVVETRASMDVDLLNGLPEDDCFTDRKVVKNVNDLMVEVLQKDNRFYFVYEHTHYEPCHMPEELSETGKKCKITGGVLEIFPFERRAGTPFVIKGIKL